jgi:hypothetical protein
MAACRSSCVRRWWALSTIPGSKSARQYPEQAGPFYGGNRRVKDLQARPITEETAEQWLIEVHVRPGR